jgi:hypothetical protein
VSQEKINFPYQPGQKLTRKSLHQKLGGIKQGGICPSNQGYIFIFSDPKSGDEFGYHDGWSDNYFLYFGSGQEGDMEFTGRNKSLLNHIKDKKTVHLFMGSRGEVIYENELEIDAINPYELIESNDKNGESRIAIVFRFKPVNKFISKLPKTNIEIHKETLVEDISLERFLKESFSIRASESKVGIRKESKLLTKYATYRNKHKQSPLTAKLIKIKGDKKTDILKVDGWIESDKLLIEAKSGCTRNKIRLAIGQLLDYKRYLKPKQMAILLPSKPKDDLVELLLDLNIEIIYQVGGEEFSYLKN